MMMDHGSQLTLRARAAWAHDFDTDRAIFASFQTLPGAASRSFGASPAADAALLSAGAELKFPTASRCVPSSTANFRTLEHLRRHRRLYVSW